MSAWTIGRCLGSIKVRVYFCVSVDNRTPVGFHKGYGILLCQRSQSDADRAPQRFWYICVSVWTIGPWLGSTSARIKFCVSLDNRTLVGLQKFKVYLCVSVDNQTLVGLHKIQGIFVCQRGQLDTGWAPQRLEKMFVSARTLGCWLEYSKILVYLCISVDNRTLVGLHKDLGIFVYQRRQSDTGRAS